jgi:hypothetical protein
MTGVAETPHRGDRPPHFAWGILDLLASALALRFSFSTNLNTLLLSSSPALLSKGQSLFYIHSELTLLSRTYVLSTSSLACKVISTPDGFILSQQCYILDLLHKSNISEAKPIKSPMSIAHALSLFSGDPLIDPSSYRGFVGALQYLSLTCPDVSFAVNKVSQFLHWPPTSFQLQAMKCILRYLQSTISYGLLLLQPPYCTLQTFSNAD